MRCVSRRIEYASRSDAFRLVLMSDLHLGTRYCDERLLRQTVQSIADDPFALWLGLGDYCEWINRKDPRAKESDRAVWLHGIDDIAGVQSANIGKILTPIADKCIGMIKGNHEYSIDQHTERDVYGGLVNKLLDARQGEAGLRLGPNGFMTLRFSRVTGEDRGTTWSCVIYATHGCSGGRKMGGKALRLVDIWATVEADVVITGHTHTPMWLLRDRQIPTRRKRNNIAQLRTAHLINAGSFLGNDEIGWPEYARRKDYPPTQARVVELRILPDKRKIEFIGRD